MLEFGPFRLDLEQRLLLRDGKPAPLPPKAVLNLCVLAESPGRLVEREELMKRVWPDTHVEEGNLSVNIFALRKALADGMNGTPAIETIPRRGYRFVAPLRGADTSAAEAAAPAAKPTPAPKQRAVPWKVGLGLAAMLALALVARPMIAPAPGLKVTRVSQVTHFGLAQEVVTDGERLYIGQEMGSRKSLVEASIGEGDPVPLETPLEDVKILDIAPNQKELLVSANGAP
jgi:DNA-binding winged helix-turn-helix (wHTH) protein